jgi:hypothetical protein
VASVLPPSTTITRALAFARALAMASRTRVSSFSAGITTVNDAFDDGALDDDARRPSRASPSRPARSNRIARRVDRTARAVNE